MEWKEIGKKVAGIGLPLVGTALGGPAGGAVGTLLAGALGVADEPTAVATAIETDPDAKLKLMELQTRHQEEMEKLALEAKRIEIEKQRVEQEGEKAYLDDRVNARQRDEALIAAGKDNKRANLMILGDVVGLVVCAIGAIFGDTLGVSEPGRMFLATIASYFGLGLRDAHAFEFGSSRGSRDKDLALQNMVPVTKQPSSPA